MAKYSRALSGRSAEKQLLLRLMESEKPEFLAIYGRRRVGKTFLVRRYFQDQSVTYFEMVGKFGGSLQEQLQIFSESLSEAFHKGVELAQPQGWHDAFRSLRKSIEGRRSRKRSKIVLFFDELPWVATRRSGFLRELEHFWNAWCSKREDIILIVCGSAASWMLKKIVNARGGLHNRLTQTIRLMPFTLVETRGYFEDRKIGLTEQSLIELYLVFGGIPHYLDHVQRGESVPQIISSVCLGKDGALANEFDRLFASLFDADKAYVDVVRALSKRRGGLSRGEVLDQTGLASGGGTTTILENLEEGGFVSSTIPFGRTTRDRLIKLTDEFSLFHLTWLQSRPPKNWQHVRKTPRWRAWVGLAFEQLCLKHASAIEKELGISGVQTTVSAWWHEDAQIDLLIDRADDIVTVCEMKFTDEPFAITKKYAEELRTKTRVFREQTKTRKGIHLVFVTSRGVSNNKYAEELVDGQMTMDVFLR